MLSFAFQGILIRFCFYTNDKQREKGGALSNQLLLATEQHASECMILITQYQHSVW